MSLQKIHSKVREENAEAEAPKTEETKPEEPKTEETPEEKA